jgi:hypothetical protein
MTALGFEVVLAQLEIEPPPKMEYADQFGTPQRQRDISAVRHIARNKLIPVWSKYSSGVRCCTATMLIRDAE